MSVDIKRVPNLCDTEKTRYDVIHEGVVLGQVVKRYNSKWWHAIRNGVSHLTYTREYAIRRLAMYAGIDIPASFKSRKVARVPQNHIQPANRFAFERSDCTVCALANATPLSYPEVHEILKADGRQNGRGFRFKLWIKYRAQLAMPGIKLNLIYDEMNYKPDVIGGASTKHLTLNQFVSSKPQGNYVVIVKRHTFAVVDGLVIDHIYNGPRKRIEQIFKVELT